MQRRTIITLIATVLILITVGLIMMFSASLVRGQSSYDKVGYFLWRQIRWLILSSIVAIGCARIDLNFLRKMALPIAGVCILLLVLVLIPGIGHESHGSWRWLRVGPLTVQPSEFSKIGVLLAVAWWISRRRRYMHTFKRGFIVPLLGLGVFAGLLILEPDFGTTMLVSLVGFALLFIGGARLIYLFSSAMLGACVFGLFVFNNANRMGRIIAFLDPEKYAQEEAWQLINAWTAFASGGACGTGLGNSIQKQFYLPEAHTDFIFPIIGEELGVVASCSVLLLFVVLFICGLRIASQANDDFGRFTALGITLMITFQALINLAVVTGSMPTKGLALPFISYGGSSLLVCSAMIGILVNVAHTARNPRTKKKTELFKDSRCKA